jgi:(4S)-4-hydroxy-5-phosphonooxypentane-2,3-dione isomerase
MRPLVVLVEFFVKPSFIAQFRDLIANNAKTSLEREAGCTRFEVLFEPRRSVLDEMSEEGADVDEHFASSRYLSFAGAIEGQIEQRSISRLDFFSAMATSEANFK